jgi:hypothetical protein
MLVVAVLGPYAVGLPAGRAPSGSEVCRITNPAAVELSGLIATDTGYIAVNDSRPTAASMRVFYLDASCRVIKSVRYPTPPRDPEDLAVGPDGTVWVADVGDNAAARDTIALWQLPLGGGPAVIHRLTYPDGPHDAEALLINGAGEPVIITKGLGPARLYQPETKLVPKSATGVALRKVGQFQPVATGVSNPLGTGGELLVTGAATAPDRRRVVLRTYAAAYEWDVPNGDPVAAITTQAPRVTQLPDEPQGEAICYTPDGSAFLTVSDEAGLSVIRRYVPGTALLAIPPATTPAAAPPKPAHVSATPVAWVPTWVAVTGAALGLALAAAGLLGLRRRDLAAGRG